ncbi:MAG: hypothetical protein MK116_00960 [Phycisphaerales bacterium]|nr:hypothetical protein [Phycisphaerales bacterium]
MAGLLALATPAANGDLPSLAASESSILSTTRDHTEVPDEAFAVLADHVRRWDDLARDEALRLRLVAERLLESPEAARGELHRVEGRLAERRSMASPYEDLEEWFLRLPTGEPIAVYLPSISVPGGIKTGRPVTIDARFYKVMTARARDGQQRRYLAFFGAAPQPVLAQRAAVLQRMDIMVLLGLLVLLAIVFLAVFAMARKQPTRRERVSPDPVEQRPEIPDDPAAALRYLRAQARQGERS